MDPVDPHCLFDITNPSAFRIENVDWPIRKSQGPHPVWPFPEQAPAKHHRASRNEVSNEQIPGRISVLLVPAVWEDRFWLVSCERGSHYAVKAHCTVWVGIKEFDLPLELEGGRPIVVAFKNGHVLSRASCKRCFEVLLHAEI